MSRRLLGDLLNVGEDLGTSASPWMWIVLVPSTSVVPSLETLVNQVDGSMPNLSKNEEEFCCPWTCAWLCAC